jgi:hypothetical protein
MEYQKGISKNSFRCDACEKVLPWSLFGGVIVNPFTSKEGFDSAIPKNLHTIIEFDRKLLTDSAGDYTSKQTRELMAKYLSPLEWKTLYPICISCIKILDGGFDASFFNDAIGTEIVDKLENWFYTSFLLLYWTDEFGKPAAGLLGPDSFRPMNFVRPVNMLRVKVIRLFNKAEERERQTFLEQPQIFVTEFYQESTILLKVPQATWNRTFTPAETKEARAKVKSILEAQAFFAKLDQRSKDQRSLFDKDELDHILRSLGYTPNTLGPTQAVEGG